MPPSDETRVREAAHALAEQLGIAWRGPAAHNVDAIADLITRERADAEAGAWRDAAEKAESVKLGATKGAAGNGRWAAAHSLAQHFEARAAEAKAGSTTAKGTELGATPVTPR